MDQMGLKSKTRRATSQRTSWTATSRQNNPTQYVLVMSPSFQVAGTKGLSFIDHGSKRPEYSGTRVVDIPVNEADVYLVKECDHVA
ncbi:transposase-like protein [Corynebacterium diphtheriae]|nr:transposase-like protein [Corynebacterium diphtheriae]